MFVLAETNSHSDKGQSSLFANREAARVGLRICMLSPLDKTRHVRKYVIKHVQNKYYARACVGIKTRQKKRELPVMPIRNSSPRCKPYTAHPRRCAKNNEWQYKQR